MSSTNSRLFARANRVDRGASRAVFPGFLNLFCVVSTPVSKRKRGYSICIHILLYNQHILLIVDVCESHSRIQMPKLVERVENDGDDRQSRRRSMDGEPLSISVSCGQAGAEKTTTTVDGRFVQAQLLIDCLLRMQSSDTEREAFISYCRQAHPDKELLIHELAQTYNSENALQWYTRDCFLYRLLNSSLRNEEINVLFELRFFIRDLQKQLQLQQRLTKTPTSLFRGQMMSLDEVMVLKKYEKRLISINQFFSTTSDPSVARVFHAEKATEDQLQPVLFVIHADPTRKGIKPFANIQQFSQFPQEREYLMMLGSVFRLDRVECDANQRWTIFMTLCSDQDHDLQSIFLHMTNQYGTGQTRLLLFGHVLVDMARFDEAQKFYERLLNELTDEDNDKSDCYHALGKIALEKGEYSSALDHLNKSIAVTEARPTVDQDHLAFLFTGIGEVYQKQGNYPAAMESYLKAMLIWREAMGEDHEYLAWCYNNLGAISDLQGDYSQSLEFLRQASKIKSKVLPPQHPCQGNTHVNLGNVSFHLEKYDQAMEYYQSAFKIYQASLTPYHPSIASALRNVGLAYEMKNEYEKALKTYEEVSSMRQRTLSPKHPDRKETRQDIRRVEKKIKLEGLQP